MKFKYKNFILPTPLLFTFCILLSFSNPLQAFTSPEGGFSIRMAGKPRAQQVNHKSMVGDVKETTYTVKNVKGEWSVSYTVLPDIALSTQSDQALLNRAKEGFVKDVGVRETSFEKISLQGKEGRELSYEIPAQGKQSAISGKARFFISNKKMYVIAGSSSANGAKSSIEQYLNSFKLSSP